MLSLSLKCTFVFLLCEILRIKHINKVAKRFQMLLISNILYLSKGSKAELRSNSICILIKSIVQFLQPKIS